MHGPTTKTSPATALSRSLALFADTFAIPPSGIVTVQEYGSSSRRRARSVSAKIARLLPRATRYFYRRRGKGPPENGRPWGGFARSGVQWKDIDCCCCWRRICMTTPTAPPEEPAEPRRNSRRDDDADPCGTSQTHALEYSPM